MSKRKFIQDDEIFFDNTNADWNSNGLCHFCGAKPWCYSYCANDLPYDNIDEMDPFSLAEDLIVWLHCVQCFQKEKSKWHPDDKVFKQL